MGELWLDCAPNYSDVPTPQQVADLWSLGFCGAIVNTSYGHAKGLQQIAAFEAGGFGIMEYQFPNAYHPTARPWWTDAENTLATVDTLRRDIAAGAQGPYSRISWATENLPNWDCKAEFPSAKLWDARYINHPMTCVIEQAVSGGGDVAAAIVFEMQRIRPFVSYWGFTEAAIVQWHDSIDIAGMHIDLNWVEKAQPEEDEMRSFLAWSSGSVFFVGPNGARWITQQAVVDELAAIYGPVTIGLSEAALKAIGLAP